MKKLSKAQQEEKAKLLGELEDAFGDVENAISDLNEKVKEMWGDVEDRVSDYNAVVEKANEFIGTVAESMQEYADERSEKWQESDAASSFAEWQGQWEEQLEDLELFAPDEIDSPEDEATAALKEKDDEAQG